MKRILVVSHSFFEDDLVGRIRSRAADFGFTPLVFDSRIPGDSERAAEAVRDAEILFAFSPKLLRACGKNLKWFACMSAGVDLFTKDPDLFPNPDVIMTNSNVYGPTIAEHVIMVLLMMMRKMPAYQKAVESGEWTRNLPIESIAGSSFLVLGTGNLGTNIAERLRGMNAGRIVGVNRTGTFRGDPQLFEAVKPADELDTLLPNAKAVILAIPDTEGTNGILSRERIALLPNGAYVVNVGRGTLIDQEALIDALNAEKLAGAALDVMLPEPLPSDSPLRSAKNILLTPHVSGDTSLRYTREALCDRFLAELERYANGLSLRGFVDRKKGY